MSTHKEQLLENLLELLDACEDLYDEVLKQSRGVRKTLHDFRSNKNIPTYVPTTSLDAFLGVFDDAAGKLHSDEVMLAFVISDTKAVVEDLTAGNIGKSLRQLLLSLHLRCNQEIILINRRLGTITGAAISHLEYM